MKRNPILCAVICIMMLSILASSIIMAVPAEAVNKTNLSDNSVIIVNNDANGEVIEMTCRYPVLSSYAGLNYVFDIDLQYKGGKEPKTFDLKATFPQGFNGTITPGYQDTREIQAIRLDPAKSYPDSIKFSMTPYIWKVPAPGTYPIVFEASSGDLKSTLNLTAIVTVNYEIKMSTPDGRLNTEATAGQDNKFTVTLSNLGTGDLEKVEVKCESSVRPAGWSVTCDPALIDLLKAGDSKEVEVTIKPTEKTISGDYMIKVSAEPESRIAFTNLEIRVTVLTPTIWGWVGVGIVILVVIALAVIFIRFGRR